MPRGCPSVPELKKLRETALKFVKDVRGSGAAEALAGSEAALADFAGTHAYEKAKEAAEILNRFVSRCQGEGDMAEECQGALVFQPKLSQCLGNTIAQLLAEMGLGSSSGGMGGRGTMGLYGDTAGMSGFGSGEFGEPSNGSDGRGDQPGANASSGGNPDAFAPGEARRAGPPPRPARPAFPCATAVPCGSISNA